MKCNNSIIIEHDDVAQNTNFETIFVDDIESAEIQIADTDYEENKENVKHGRKSFLLAGKYFSIISEDDKVVKAKCLTCEGIYSANKNTTSNFIKHLKVKNTNSEIDSRQLTIVFFVFRNTLNHMRNI